MRKNIIFKAVCAVLALSIIFGALAGCKKSVTDNPILKAELEGTEYVQQEYSQIADSAKKEETVYVNLAPDGTVKNVSVTDWLHTNLPQVRIEDMSSLSNIQNVKTLTSPVKKDGKLYWDMDTTDLYYNGTTDKQPPVNFSIKYFLDGKELSAAEIAGKKGEVKIQISVSNTLKKTVNVLGKECEITCPMLVAGGMILSEENFSNITIDNGSAISDGAKQIIFFAGIPGIDKSLGLSELGTTLIDKSMYSDVYTITAHSENFELGNMMFAVMPFSSVWSIGNGGLPDTVDDVKDVLTDIERVQEAMKGLDVQRIIDLLYGDSDKISEMMSAVSDAVTLYNENEKMLKVFGSYMTDENMKKLDKLIADLNNTDLDAVSETLSDPALKTLLSILPELSDTLGDVAVLADDLNEVMPIFESLAKEMDDPEIAKSVENLPETLTKLKELLDVVDKNRELLDALGAFASGDSTEQIEAILETADKYADLEMLTEEQTEMLAGKAKEWLVFGSEYKIFTECAPDTDTSVIFTYKTDAVTAPEETAVAPAEEKAEGNKFVSWLKNLFD